MSKLIVRILAIVLCSIASACTNDKPSEVGLNDEVLDVKIYTEKEVRALINIGDSYLNVVGKLGKPTNDDETFPKMGGAKIGRRLLYIYEMKVPASFNAGRDHYLRLWFDADDRLEEIDYHSGS